MELLKAKIEKDFFSSVEDSKGKKTTLINLFYSDRKRFDQELKKETYDQNTISFFDYNEQILNEIFYTISIDFFRKDAYLKAIDKYCRLKVEGKLPGEKKKKNTFAISSNQEKRKKASIKIKFQEENSSIINKSFETTYRKKPIMIYSLSKIKLCECGCNGSYDVMASYDENGIEKIGCVFCLRRYLEGKTNRTPKDVTSIEKCFNGLIRKTLIGKLKWTIRAYNDESINYSKFIPIESEKELDFRLVKVIDLEYLKTEYTVFFDGKKYKYDDIRYIEDAIMLSNPEIIPVKVRKKTEGEIRAARAKRLAELHAATKERHREKDERLKAYQQKKKKLAAERAEEHRLFLAAEKERKQKELQEAKLKKAQEKKEPRKKEQDKKDNMQYISADRAIDVKDFLVRRSVFKCMHDNHKIEDISAVVNVINRAGTEHPIKISAGYCSECNVYFIMESAYEKLKIFGIPLCRVSDEKTYLQGGSIHGMRLANQSILMQYGYNVSQEEGLPETLRHKILANLIDRKVLRKSEIISYLDFFISQRQSQYKYERAIAKWQLDRDFVMEYKIGKYQEFGVHGLYR